MAQRTAEKKQQEGRQAAPKTRARRTKKVEVAADSDQSPQDSKATGSARPIRPSTSDSLQYNLGIDRADMYFALGATRASIYRKGGANGLVSDPTLSLLIRYYLDQPHLATDMIPPTPHPTEVMEKLSPQGEDGEGALTKRRFALLLGRSATFPTYAMRPGGGGVAHGTPIARLLLAIENDCALNGPNEALERLVSYVDEEMKTRGIDALGEGSWGRRKALRAHEDSPESEAPQGKRVKKSTRKSARKRGTS